MKLNFCLEILDNTEKAENKNPSIGILLFTEKGTLEIEYALTTTKKAIGISEYHLTKDLPEKYQDYLPDNKLNIERLVFQNAQLFILPPIYSL